MVVRTVHNVRVAESKPLRILYPVNSDFPPNRANGIQVVKTARAAAEAGAEIWLLMRRASRESIETSLASMGLDSHPRLHIRLLPVLKGGGDGRRAKIANFSFYLTCLPIMGWMASRGQIDVIHTRLITRRIFAPMVWLRNRFGLKLVFESHQPLAAEYQGQALAPPVDPESLLPEARRAFREEELIYREADGLIFISDSLAEYAKGLFGFTSPVIVAHDAAEIGPPNPEVRATLDQIGYSGSFGDTKGVDLLVEALEHLPESMRLVLVGGGAGAVRIPKAVEERVRMIDRVHPRDVPKRLAEPDILALPTLDTIQSRHSSPLKLFEYMAAGRPIVASGLPGICEILRHEENALLFRPGDVLDFAAQVERLRDDVDLARRLAKQARIDVARRTWRGRGEKIVNFIDSLT